MPKCKKRGKAKFPFSFQSREIFNRSIECIDQYLKGQKESKKRKKEKGEGVEAMPDSAQDLVSIHESRIYKFFGRAEKKNQNSIKIM